MAKLKNLELDMLADDLDFEELSEAPSLNEQAGEFFQALTPSEKMVVFYFSVDAPTTLLKLQEDHLFLGKEVHDVAAILKKKQVKQALQYLGILDKEISEDDIRRKLTRILLSPMSSETASLRASAELSKLMSLYATKTEMEGERANLRNFLQRTREIDKQESRKTKRGLPTPEETLIDDQA
jgi:hypothetical protein